MPQSIIYDRWVGNASTLYILEVAQGRMLLPKSVVTDGMPWRKKKRMKPSPEGIILV